MRILLISRFNVPNIGDLAISNKVYEDLNKVAEVDRFNLFGEPFTYKDINKVNDITIKKSIINWTLKSKRLSKIIKKVKNFTVQRSISNKEILASIVDEYEIVIFAGGNMMMSLNDYDSTIKRINEYVSVVKNSGKQLYFMSIGIGPFYSEKHSRLAIDTLKQGDYISFRDSASKELYENNGGGNFSSVLTVDPVFFYGNERTSNQRYKINKKIAINIIDPKVLEVNQMEYQMIIEGYKNIIQSLLDHNFNHEIILYTTSIEDSNALNKVYKPYKKYNSVERVFINGIEDLNELYKNTDVLLGTRMHSMIIAYTFLIPIVGLSWQTKIDEFFKLTQQSESCFNLFEINNNYGNISAKIIDKLNNVEVERPKILTRLKEIRTLGESDKKIIDNIEQKYKI